MSILSKIPYSILYLLYTASWFNEITFIQFCILYVSAFFAVIAGLQYDQSQKTPADKEVFYYIYLSHWWMIRLAVIFLFFDLFKGHQVIFGFGLFFSIVSSFGIVALTSLIFYYKSKLEKAEM
jgi:hypothetical protein